MKKILIINLGNESSIIESSYLLGSMLNSFPHDQVYYLCKSSTLKTAQIISGVQKLYSVDLENIETILNNPLYSDAFALNTLSENLEEILNTSWDKVINYDNSTISAYITSAIDKESFNGAEIYKNGNVLTSNIWASYQNFCLDTKKRMHIDRKTIIHNIVGVPLASHIKRIKSSNEFNAVANQNFQRIRANDDAAYKFIGIYLPDNDENALKDNLIVDTIRFSETLNECKVVLIHNGAPFSTNLVNKLNQSFNNTLISIHADNEALPSVLLNLEIFISTRNYVTVMAQALGLKTIEICSLNKNKFYYSGDPHRSFIIDNNENTLDFYDIACGLNHFLSPSQLDNEMSSSPLYVVEEDDYGSFITQINGPIDINSELSYHISRALDYGILGKRSNPDFINHIKECTSIDVLRRFTLENKEVLTNSVKALLATLRSVKTALNSKEGMHHFLINLEKLIHFNKNENICSVAVGLFEAKIENITNLDARENLKMIEAYLFELKNDLQQINLFLDQLISHSRPIFSEARI